MSDKLLVTGASGQFGRAVLRHLVDTLAVPADRIIATTRNPDALSEWSSRGVEVRAADFESPVSLAAAFAGADRLLLISTDAIDRPGRRLAQHRAAIAAAVQAGVAHVLYTSMPLPEGSPLLIAPDHAQTEAALAASALPGWTVLRNHWYFENLLLSLPAAIASGGQWYSAAGDGRIAHIARDDLARAAAAALASSSEGKRAITLSGSTAYTTAEIAAIVANVVGKPIEVVQVPVEAIVQGMVSHGFPEDLARAMASFDTNTAAGRVADVTDEYQRLTGATQMPFEGWVADNRQAFTG